MNGELLIDKYITHEFHGAESIEGAIHLVLTGACLRAHYHSFVNVLRAIANMVGIVSCDRQCKIGSVR